MTLTVHHLERSRSHRVLWALEELGLTYELRTYARHPTTLLAPPELQRVHPLGKSPVLTDGDLTLAESGAILEYLAARYGNGRLVPPRDSPEYLQYIYWLHYAEGSLMPVLLVQLIMSKVQKAPLVVRPVARSIAAQVNKAYVHPNLQRHFDHIEQALEKSTWFVGEELTMADIQMSYPIEAALERAGAGRELPAMTAFLRRVRQRPAYQRAVARGGEPAPVG